MSTKTDQWLAENIDKVMREWEKRGRPREWDIVTRATDNGVNFTYETSRVYAHRIISARQSVYFSFWPTTGGVVPAGAAVRWL